MDAEKQAFLTDERSRYPGETNCCDCCKRKVRHQNLGFWIISFIAQAIILITTFALLINVPRIKVLLEKAASPTLDLSSPSLYSPARDAIRYETVVPSADAWENSIYTGDPSHESDTAWKKLLATRGVSLSTYEATQLNLTTLSSPGGGHAKILGVNHNLHCVRYIRQVLHPDYYYPSETAVEREENVIHAHHCLEAIRLSAMCTPDLTPHSLYWEHIESPKVAARPDVPRDCVNWDMLGSWMEARAYTLADLVKANARQGK